MANVDHREGVVVRAPRPAIEAPRAPFGSGRGAYQICRSRRRSTVIMIAQRFIAAKLEVIRTDLMLHIQHVPRLVGQVAPSFRVRLT